MSYDVFGEQNNIIIKYASANLIFQGSVFFKDEQLIQGSGNQFRAWEKNIGRPVLAPYQMPPYPDAFVIRYSIIDENTVRISQTDYTLPVGSIVQFMREDFNDVTERDMFSGECSTSVQIATFQISCKTKFTATIIPGGYNWEGAKDIIINTV